MNDIPERDPNPPRWWWGEEEDEEQDDGADDLYDLEVDREIEETYDDE